MPSIDELEAEIASFAQEKAECEDRAKELIAHEDPANKIFHHEEIFLLKQDKLRLETEILFRKNKLARLRFEQ
ncbi:hypothetical protein [Desulfoplanes sp.]